MFVLGTLRTHHSLYLEVRSARKLKNRYHTKYSMNASFSKEIDINFNKNKNFVTVLLASFFSN